MSDPAATPPPVPADTQAQAERLAALGRLAAGIAHDLNNVLTAIVGYCDLARLHQSRPEQMAADLAEAVASAGRATDITRRLAMFARRHAGEPRPLELDAVLRDLERRIRASSTGSAAMALGAPGALVLADPFYLREAVETIVAWGRLAGARAVTITTGVEQVAADEARRRVDAREGPHVRLSVTHHGLVLPADYARRALEPFAPGRPAGDDGLKLASAYGLVVQAGGHALTEAGPGAFHVRLWWPRAARGGEVDAPTRTSADVAAPRVSAVLVVEDESSMRALLEELLQDAGYEVRTCSGGPEAVALLERREFSPDVVVSDVVMAEVSGEAVAEAAQRLYPGVATLLISGHDAPAGCTLPFLRKPFTQDALLQTVALLAAGVTR